MTRQIWLRDRGWSSTSLNPGIALATENTEITEKNRSCEESQKKRLFQDALRIGQPLLGSRVKYR
jgi:hypothetical protein